MSLVDLLARRAEEEADRLQYRFLDDDVEMTVGDLHALARRIGAALRADVGAGDRVVLLLPPGRAFVAGFFGAMFAGAVPVPVAPPGRARLARGLGPVRSITADCTPTAVLTVAGLRDIVLDHLDAGDPLRAPAWLTVEDLARGGGDAEPVPRPADDVAYLQYTSGSTSNPRGVRVTHTAVDANLRVIGTAFEHHRADHGMIWLPPHHDMGLVGGLLAPLHASFPVSLASPQRFLQSPIRWLRWISDLRATVSGGPDFAFRACVERIRDDQLEGLDLASWRVAFTGAEPISARTLRAFADRFATIGFREEALHPCYGLAEATLMVTGGHAGRRPVVRSCSRHHLEHDWRAATPDPAAGLDDVRTFVSCGSPVGPDDDLVVVDPESRRALPDGTVGELWFRGPSVGSGYHGEDGSEDGAFAAHLADGSGPYLRTGDLGFVVDGELYVTGRAKDVIVVRGRNLDAHDVEACVTDALVGHRTGLTAALSVVDEHERLVVLQEVGGRTPADEVVDAIQVALAARFDVRADDVGLVPIGSLPRTTSGKLKRSQAGQQYARGTIGADHDGKE